MNIIFQNPILHCFRGVTQLFTAPFTCAGIKGEPFFSCSLFILACGKDDKRRKSEPWSYNDLHTKNDLEWNLNC